MFVPKAQFRTATLQQRAQSQAFALSGRRLHAPNTQGDALGYRLVGLSGRLFGNNDQRASAGRWWYDCGQSLKKIGETFVDRNRDGVTLHPQSRRIAIIRQEAGEIRSPRAAERRLEKRASSLRRKRLDGCLQMIRLLLVNDSIADRK